MDIVSTPPTAVSSQRRAVGTNAFVICACVAFSILRVVALSAAVIHPEAVGSHRLFIEGLTAEQRRNVAAIVARYDEYLKRHPDDAQAAIERCTFLDGALLGDDEENPLEKDFDACLDDLTQRFPGQPDVTLYRLGRTAGGAEQAERLLESNGLDWSPTQLAALHGLIARQLQYAKGKSARAVEHAREAMALDPSLDLSLVVARDLRERGEREQASLLLAQHLEDKAEPWVLAQKVDELLALGDFAPAERGIALLESTGRPADAMQKGAAQQGLGRLDEARAQYAAAAESGRQRAEARRKLLEIDIARGDEGAAVASYEALRDLGYDQDPILLRRLKLAARFPTAPWQGRDVLGGLLFACLVFAAGLLPLAWIVPLHYIELRRQARALPLSEWRWRDAWYASAATLAAQVAAGIAFFDLANPYRGLAQSARSAAATPMMLVAAVGLTTVALLPLAWRHRAAWRKHWSIGRTIGVALGVIIALRVLMFVYLAAIGGAGAGGEILQDALRGIGTEFGSVMQWLVVVLLAPFYEELVFRGAVLGALQRLLPFWVGNVFQATLFGLMHGSVTLLPFYLAMGLALGVIQRRSRGLLAPFITHLLNNLLVVAAMGLMH